MWAAGNVADAMLGVGGAAAAGFAAGAAINADLVADDLAQALSNAGNESLVAER